MFKSITLHYSHYSTTASTTRITSQISMNISLCPLLKRAGKPAVITSKEPMKSLSAKDSILTKHSSMKHSMVNGTAKTQGLPLLSGPDTENGEPKYKSATGTNVWYTIFITKETNMKINTDSKILPYIIWFSSFIISTIIIKTIGIFGLIPLLLLVALFPLEPKPDELHTISQQNHTKLTSKDSNCLITRASK